jgi:hypothetical protein
VWVLRGGGGRAQEAPGSPQQDRRAASRSPPQRLQLPGLVLFAEQAIAGDALCRHWLRRRQRGRGTALQLRNVRHKAVERAGRRAARAAGGGESARARPRQ